MTKWGLMGLGGLMALAGCASAWQGWDIVQVERGWTQVIAGMTVATGGLVVVALAFVLDAIDHLRTALIEADRRPAQARGPAASAPPPAPAASAQPSPPPPPPEPSLFDFDRPAAPDAPADSSVPAAQPAALAPRADRPFLAAPPAPRRASLPQRLGTLKPLEAAPAPADAPQTTIISRHHVGGSNYVLYGDGSIEAQTPAGPLRFASMAEFRVYIETQDGDPPAA